MARIILDKPTLLVQRRLLLLTSDIIAISDRASRLKAITDQITVNGTLPALLETSIESLVPVGTGAAINTGITQINTALASLSSLVSSIDQGG